VADEVFVFVAHALESPGAVNRGYARITSSAWIQGRFIQTFRTSSVLMTLKRPGTWSLQVCETTVWPTIVLAPWWWLVKCAARRRAIAA